MAASPSSESPALGKKQNPFVVVSLYLVYLAAVGRTLARFSEVASIAPKFTFFIAVELAFLVLFTLAVWIPRIPRPVFHVYLVIQTVMILAMFIYEPEIDFVPNLFICLSYQVAVFFTGRIRWIWIAIIVFLIGGVVWLLPNPGHNFSLQLTTMAGVVVIAAYVASSQEVEIARRQTQDILAELEVTHHQLEAFSGQVEELAVIEERNRLARDLHDSVSQTMFSINLNIRSARHFLVKDPARLRPQLQILAELCQSALADMRSLITQLRPKSE